MSFSIHAIIYSGGSLLARLNKADLPQYDLYCLVRTDEQKEAVKSYGAIPVELDLRDQEAITKFIVDNRSEYRSLVTGDLQAKHGDGRLPRESRIFAYNGACPCSQYCLLPH